MQNEILVGRFGQWVTRLFGIRGPNPSPQVSPEVQITADLLEGPPETRYYQDVRLAAGYCVPRETALVQSQAMFRNPVGSNAIVVIERLTITNTKAAPHGYWVDWGQALADLAGVVATAKKFRDSRPGATGASPLLSLSEFAGAPGLPGLGVLQCQVPATDSSTFVIEQVLHEGFALVVQCQDVQTQFAVTAHWYERGLAPSEQF